MFKRTLRLLQEKQNNLPDKHKKILDFYTPNDNLVDIGFKVPYELRGEYLPRRKINPFKKRPLTVYYDRKDYQSFVLPSKREEVYGQWNFDELFGIKRWRNDSPFIKEYIRVDNQIFLICILALILLSPIVVHRIRSIQDSNVTYITHHLGKYDENDLI